MIRRDILIDSKELCNSGINKSYISKRQPSILGESKADVNVALQANPVGHSLVVFETSIVVLTVFVFLLAKSSEFRSWQLFGTGMVIISFLIWAISMMNSRAKQFLKILYYWLQTITFMVVLASGGYFYGKLIGVESVSGLVIYSLFTAIPSIMLHLPFLNKSRILSI